MQCCDMLWLWTSMLRVHARRVWIGELGEEGRQVGPRVPSRAIVFGGDVVFD